MLVLFLGVAILSMLSPIIIGHMINNGILHADRSLLLYFAGLLLLLSGSLSVLNVVKTILFRRFQTHLIRQLQSEIMGRLFKLPLTFFDSYSIGELSHRTLVIESLSKIVSENQLGAYLSFICSFFSFGIMMYYDWHLTCCVLLMVTCFWVVSTWSAFQVLPYLEHYLEQTSQTFGFLYQVINGILRIKSFAKESSVASIITEKYSQARLALSRAHRLGIWRFTLFKNIQLLMTLILFGVILQRAEQVLSFEHFIVFFTAFSQFIVGFTIFLMNQNSLVPAITTYKRLLPIFQTPIEHPTPLENAPKPLVFSGDIFIKHLSFCYPSSGSYILRDINCNIPLGQHTAIVGLSGSGKSTLLKLLLGLYTPQQGDIYFGNQTIQQIDLSMLRKQIGVVLQNSHLATGTILENLVGSNENEDEAWRVVRQVGLERFIQSLPMKMNTMMTQHMNLISGGQKQLS